jgi:hypothetical protein
MEFIVGLQTTGELWIHYEEIGPAVLDNRKEWFGWAEVGFANLDNRVVIEPPEPDENLRHS